METSSSLLWTTKFNHGLCSSFSIKLFSFPLRFFVISFSISRSDSPNYKSSISSRILIHLLATKKIVSIFFTWKFASWILDIRNSKKIIKHTRSKSLAINRYSNIILARNERIGEIFRRWGNETRIEKERDKVKESRGRRARRNVLPRTVAWVYVGLTTIDRDNSEAAARVRWLAQFELHLHG